MLWIFLLHKFNHICQLDDKGEHTMKQNTQNKRIKFVTRLLFASSALALFISACSGEGGSSSNESNSSFDSSIEESSISYAHTGKHYKDHPATCTEDGIREYWECDECHGVFFDGKGEDVLDGLWEDVATIPAEPDENAIIPALGHSWVRKESDTGLDYLECSRCGEIMESSSVSTLADLVKYCEIGVPSIEIASDIVVNEPIYVKGEVELFCNANHSIKRAPDYDGDLFVVGEDQEGNDLAVDNAVSVLTIGNKEATGTLSIDGNKANTTKTVKGSLVYVSYSGVFNLEDKALLKDNKKEDNERAIALLGETLGNQAGGSAVLVAGGTFNMNGGSITNCESSTGSDKSILGGAIFNKNNFYMNGGTIAYNSSCYGGALANLAVARIKNGTIDHNTTSGSGGAIYQNSGVFVSLSIGDNTQGTTNTVVLSNNESTNSTGGAVFFDFSSSFNIFGHTTFLNNTSKWDGGAVKSYGLFNVEGEGNLFKGNISTSGDGGAISVTYRNNNVSYNYHRETTIVGARFEENEAANGGAIADNGELITLNNTTFKDNRASNKGGALYGNVDGASTPSKYAVSNSTFNGNRALYGGALNLYNGSEASFTGTTVAQNNIAQNLGGFSYINGSKLSVTGGEDRATFDTNSATDDAGGVFYTTNSSTLTIEKTDIQNNTAHGNGGAIYTSGSTVSLDDVLFDNNDSTDGNGGAIYSTGSTIEGTDISFTENSANNGGAICAYTNSEITLDGVDATGNSATSGGFVTVDGGSSVTVTGTSTALSNIKENTATEKGGAVYVGHTGTFVADYVSFKDNTSSGLGGAIYFERGTVTVSHASFDGNSAVNAGGAIYGKGVNGNLTITSSSFTNNTATKAGSASGGAITIDNSASSGSKDISVNFLGENNVFSNNSAPYGGAIYLDNATINVTKLTLTDNSSANSAGAIYVKNSDFSASEVIATNNSGANAGVFYINHSNVNIVSITATGNTGASGSVMNITNSSVVNVNIEEEGDAIFGTDDPEKKATLGNSVTGDAGVIYVNNSSFTIKGAFFGYNSSPSYTGGAILADGTSVVKVTDSEFVGNNAKNGGAIAAKATATLEVKDSTFTSNKATNSGGAIYSTSTTQAKISGSTFTSNSTTTYYGGAIYLASGADAKIDDCDFVTNSAINGGALYVESSAVSGSDLVFDRNTATTHGSAIYLNGSTYNVSSTTLTGNNGGSTAVYVYNSTANLDSLLATGNTGASGAVMNINHGSTVNINKNSEGTVTIGTLDSEQKATLGNSVTGDAGAFNVDGATLSIKGANIGYNSTSYNGGAIYALNSSSVTIVNSNFVGNSANHGGAIRIDASTVSITGSSFSNNSAVASGGAVSIKGAADVTFDSCSFTGNTSSSTGGAITADNSSASSIVLDVTFVGNNQFNSNNAPYGALYFAKANVTGATLTLNNNNNSTPATSGGALYIINSTVDLDSVSVNGSKAASTGAFYINNSTVELGSLIATKNTGPNGAVMNIVTNSTVKINEDGEGTVTIGTLNSEEASAKGNDSAGGECSGFYVGAGSSLLIKGANIGYNSTPYSGGAIYAVSNSNVQVINSNFVGNSAKNGGAIRADATATLNISGSSFTSNTATNSGGAIYLASTTQATITNSIFTSNTATNWFGGAIYQASGISSVLNNCEFVSNTTGSSNGDGGALYLTGASMSGTQITFRNNSAHGKGNAAYLTGSTFDFDNVILTGNSGGTTAAFHVNNSTVTIDAMTATGNTGVSGSVFNITGGSNVKLNPENSENAIVIGTNDSTKKATLGNSVTGDAGVIYVTGSTLEIKGALFGYNSTPYNGGVILGDGNSSIIVTDSTFVGNSANNGGAIRVNGTAYLEVNGSTFNLNTANNSAGALYINSSTQAKITDSTFTGNRANNYYGGAIYQLNGTNVIYDGCTFDGNTAKENGGAIFAEGNATLLVKNGSSFDNNSAINGGAIRVNGTASLTIQDSSFSNNSASFTSDAEASGGNGGALYIGSSTTANISNTSFDDNAATLVTTTPAKTTGGCGGAIYLSNSGTINISSSSFSNNTATNNGGAVYALGPSGNKSRVINFLGTNNEFTSNSAVYGGALYFENVDVDATKLTLVQNAATTSAGAIYVKASDFDASELVLTQNSSGNSAIYVNSTNFNATSLTATGNIGASGSVFNITNSSVVKINETGTSTVVFGTDDAEKKATLGNSVTGDAGVIYINNSSLLVNNGLFGYNSTPYSGGAIVADGASVIQLSDSTFVGNSAKNGGAIRVNGTSHIKVNSSSFTSNSAINSGGALYFASTYVDSSTGYGSTISNTTFTSNSATTYYGGVSYQTSSSNVLYDGCTFTNNNAKENGGAIYAEGSSTVSIEGDSTFEGNSAKNGGAIYDSSSALMSISDTTFATNTATSNGGAIYTGSAARFNVTGDSSFTSNVAAYGGAIYINSTGACSVEGASTNLIEFTSNHTTSSGQGGAVYARADGANASFTYASFKNNSASEGGAFLIDPAGSQIESGPSNTVTLTNITVEGNSATADAARNFIQVNHGGKVVLNGFTVVSKPDINIGWSGRVTYTASSLVWADHAWSEIFHGTTGSSNLIAI